MPRFEPLCRDDWPAQMQVALEAMVPPTPRHFVPPPGGRPGRPKSAAIMGTFARHPDLAQSFFAFNGHVLYGTTLSLRHRQFLVLRVAVVQKCRYLWAHHMMHNEDAGLTGDDLARIAFGSAAPFLEPLEQALLRAVDELVHDGVIDQSTWSALEDELDHQQIMDLIFTVGCYSMLTWVFETFELEMESDTPGFRPPDTST